MTSNSEALTPEQVKQNLRAQGKTLNKLLSKTISNLATFTK